MNGILLIVTGLALLLAGVMSAIMWRMRRDERRRSDARVAALSDAIYEGLADERAMSGRLFEQPSSPSGTRHGTVAIAGACLVSAMIGLTLVAARSPHRNATVSATAPEPLAPNAPLELLALEHDRDGERLIVRGVVQNPAGATARRQLSAVVVTVGRDGRLMSTGRAAVPDATLAPGATTPFVVAIPGADGVDRFRLSFRTDARIEPHVDRRMP
jgi:hypothetical protein